MIETSFTPLAALGGGALIGLASVMLMAFQGRIFGATGILGGFMKPDNRADWLWRAALLAGMAVAPFAYSAVMGAAVPIEVPVGKFALVIGGVLVGIGVTYGGGCTSGHGVCGMARLSPRSIVATATFMTTTAVTVYVIRHVLGF